MNIWAFNRANDKTIINFVSKSLKEGISRFGWGYKNKLDIRELAPKPWDEMTKEEIEIYNKQNFLLNIKKGDWLVHINIPSHGQVTAGQVIEEYNFDKENNEINDFRHFFKLDKDSIVEFDRNDDFVPEIISKKLKLRGRYWTIKNKDEFLKIIDAINLTDIKKELKEAKAIDILTLENKIIKSDTWKEIIKLTNIEELKFINTDFGEVPQSISNLNKVETLNIENCDITGFDVNFNELKNLKNLFIEEDFEIEFTIDNIYIENLEQLIVNKIKINKYSELEYLLNIEYINISILDLSALDIKELPTEFDKLYTLNSLDLSKNKFKNIPKVITELQNLINLDLSNNQLAEIPSELVNLKELRFLNLSKNKFKNIPKVITVLQNLKYLYLSNNQLTEIPSELVKLKNLTNLYLSGNEITGVPKQITELKNIDEIYFNSNTKVLKFSYIFPLEINKNLKKYFPNLEQVGRQTIGKNFIHIRINNNTVLFEIKILTQVNIDFKLPTKTDYEESKYRPRFNIYIFGEKEAQKQILNKIKNKFDSIISQNNIKFSSDLKKSLVTRFFYYPFYKNEIFVNYEKLLNHIKANDKFYNDMQNNIPVSDLIDFIGAENIQINKEWKGKDYVTNINIKNFKIFKDIEFKLSKNINIIIGNNGLGKTTFLQALTLGLLNRDSIEENAKKFPAYINFNAERSEIKINWGENEYRKLWIYSKGLPKEESPVNPPYNIMLSYGVNLDTTRIQEHTTFVEKLVIGKEKSYFTKSIFEDSYSEMHDPLKILEHLDNEIKLPYHLRDELKEKIKNKGKNINNEYKEIILINDLIFRTINSFLQLITESEQIQIHFHNNVYYFKDFFGNYLKTEHLSEGYKDHVLLITDILIRILSVRNTILKENKELEINEGIFQKAKGVIIIDEFDRHLHPNWQRKLLFQLKKYFSKIQFILTTHNIFSLQSAVGANAIKITMINNKIQIESSKVEAQNILSIAGEFTDFDYDYETQNELTELSDAIKEIDNGNINLAYSYELKNVVKTLLEKGEEINSMTSSFILRLNEILKNQNQKSFSL